jgi:hypothetical protein
MQDIAKLRTLLVHGLWEGYNAGPPVNTQIIRIAQSKDVPGEVEFFRSDPLAPALLRSATQKASD